MTLLTLLAQENQAPRPASKDTAGLLRINRDFYEIAASTGGDFYFWAPQEFAAANLQIPLHGEDVLLSYGSLSGKRSFEIPVERGVRSLTVFAGAQRKDLAVLVRPDRTVVQAGALQSFQHMLIATIAAPAAGIWRLEIDGAGLFCVTAHVKPAEEGPELVAFEFVDKGARPLRAAESSPCELSLSGTARKVELLFLARDGSPLGDPQLEPAGDDRYLGRCVVPASPFRVAVQGVDASGFSFRRVERQLRTPE